MKKSTLLKSMEDLDDDANIEVLIDGEVYEIAEACPDWTSSADDPPQRVPDTKRGLIIVQN